MAERTKAEVVEVEVTAARAFAAEGSPGRSPLRPITRGHVRVDPPAGSSVRIIVQSQRRHEPAPPPGDAPEAVIESGELYIEDGPHLVRVTFGKVEGMVRVMPARR